MIRLPLVRLRNVWLPLVFLLVLFGSLFVGQNAYGQDGGPASEARAIEALAQILRRPEFQWSEQQPTLAKRIWEWFLRQLFNWLPDAVGSGRILAPLLAIAGLLLLLLFVHYAARRLRRQITPSAESAEPTSLVEMRDSEAAMTRARSVAEHGDHRLALRYLYLSTLLFLDERGIVNYDRTRTNLEYLQSVARYPSLETRLREIVEIFDRAWYGLHMPDAQTYARFERRVQELRKL